MEIGLAIPLLANWHELQEIRLSFPKAILTQRLASCIYWGCMGIEYYNSDRKKAIYRSLFLCILFMVSKESIAINQEHIRFLK